MFFCCCIFLFHCYRVCFITVYYSFWSVRGTYHCALRVFDHSLGCISVTALNKDHVVVRSLLNLLYEHFHKVWRSHRGTGAYLSVKGLRQLFRILVKWENLLELPMHRSLKSAFLRQLVVIRNLDGHGPAPLLLRTSRWLGLWVTIQSTTSVARRARPTEIAASFAIVISCFGSRRIQNSFLTLTLIKHFTKSRFLDRKPLVHSVLLFCTGRLPLLVFLNHLFSWFLFLSLEFLLGNGAHHAVRKRSLIHTRKLFRFQIVQARCFPTDFSSSIPHSLVLIYVGSRVDRVLRIHGCGSFRRTIIHSGAGVVQNAHINIIVWSSCLEHTFAAITVYFGLDMVKLSSLSTILLIRGRLVAHDCRFAPCRGRWVHQVFTLALLAR